MDRRMATRALGIEAEARRARTEPSVELRHGRVATEAQLCHSLVREQMSIRRPVRCVAGRATLGARGAMLEDERPAFVGVAIGALPLLEPAEQRPRRRRVRIMA